MSTRITITFDVPNDKYKDYEECLSDFDSNLQYIGIHDVDIHENKDYTGVHYDKIALADIDSELFFNEISQDTKSWSYGYDDLEQNTKVFEYVKEYYPKELQALKNKEIDYIEVYCDY